MTLRPLLVLLALLALLGGGTAASASSSEAQRTQGATYLFDITFTAKFAGSYDADQPLGTECISKGYSESIDWVSTVEPVAGRRIRAEVWKEGRRFKWILPGWDKRYAHATMTFDAKGTFRRYRCYWVGNPERLVQETEETSSDPCGPDVDSVGGVQLAKAPKGVYLVWPGGMAGPCMRPPDGIDDPAKLSAKPINFARLIACAKSKPRTCTRAYRSSFSWSKTEVKPPTTAPLYDQRPTTKSWVGTYSWSVTFKARGVKRS